MQKHTTGKINIGVGLIVMAGFMLYGFYLIYARDLAPDKEGWIAIYAVHPHFEARLAHVHGNLFAFLNVLFGYLIMTLPIGKTAAKWVSYLAVAGLLMPIGILSEIYLGLPPILVVLGASSIVAATLILGIAVIRLQTDTARISEIE